MASFVSPISGEPTVDATVHRFEWVAFVDGDLNASLTEIQKWLTVTTINGAVRYAWTDLVALWCEFGVTGETTI